MTFLRHNKADVLSITYKPEMTGN